jgi:glyoxylase-like metal-dependent hydrolase (beta-lactamase superfamily II)
MPDPTDSPSPQPAVDPTAAIEIAKDVWVIGDRRVPLVPNIGIILGSEAALIVDTGMGPANGATVLEVARKLAGDRTLILTLTHFHPEHGYGAQAFKDVAHIFYNAAQRDELVEKGDAYLDMFRTFGPGVAAALEGARLVMPDEVYKGRSATLDLGGRKAELRTWGLAHTKGDQVVWLPEERILFTGDLAEERIFPIFPWFPPQDADLDAARWAEILTELETLAPMRVVPGHGSVGGVEILSAVRIYLLDVGARVVARRKTGQDADQIVAELGPMIRAEHPDWEAPDWIDFAIRYYAATI